MAGVAAANEDETRGFLLNVQPLPSGDGDPERDVAIRRSSRSSCRKQPIQATTEIERRILITRNTRDFTMGEAGIDIPYRL